MTISTRINSFDIPDLGPDPVRPLSFSGDPEDIHTTDALARATARG